MSKKAETFAFTKKNVIVLVAVFALIIALPTSIYAYELFSLRMQQERLTSELQEKVSKDVVEYVTTKVVNDTVLSDGSSSVDQPTTGFVTKGTSTNNIDYQAVADEVAAILTDEYIAKIEANVLDNLYAEIDTIIASKMSANSNYTDEDLKNISDAVSAIVTSDLEAYKQQVVLDYAEQDNFYTKIETLVGAYDTKIDNLSNDIAALKTMYDSKFAALEVKDANLQAQIDVIKSQNSVITSQYNSLQSSITLAKADINTLKNELQTRIETLKSSSESKDVELANLLIRAQNQLNTVDATEDAKIYDNTVRIIELTDKITNTDTTLSQAIEVLENQTGTNTAELQATLISLQAELENTQNDLSSSVNTEMTERISDIQELLSLINELSGSTSTAQDDLSRQITVKSNQLAKDLETTSSNMKTEYTALISTTNDSLTEYITQVNTALTNTINENDTKQSVNLSNTKKALEGSISDTKDSLTNTINENDEKQSQNLANTKNELNNSISDTKTTLTTYIDEENLQTREELAAAVVQLNKQIADLQRQIDELNANKLNISDSTNYEYSETDGSTIRITVPDTNPNYTHP